MNRTSPKAIQAFVTFCKLRKKLQEARKDTDASIGKQEAIIYARSMYLKHIAWRCSCD